MRTREANKRDIFTQIGARNYALTEREINDYYATEPKALELLLDIETFDKNVWECACGEGHLSKVLEARGYNVRSTDLIDRGYGEGGVRLPYLFRGVGRRYHNKPAVLLRKRICPQGY